jgi:hypothetical protein
VKKPIAYFSIAKGRRTKETGIDCRGLQDGGRGPTLSGCGRGQAFVRAKAIGIQNAVGFGVLGSHGGLVGQLFAQVWLQAYEKPAGRQG